MPLPTYFNSAARVIELGYRNALKLSEGQKPSPIQYTEGLGRLTDMINTWQIEGLKLFLHEEISIAAPVLAVGKAKYTLGPGGDVDMTKPLRVILGWKQDAAGVRSPLDPPMSEQEYNQLANTTLPGSITSYYVSKKVSTLDIYLWSAPDTPELFNTVKFIVQVNVVNPVTLTENVIFPVEWFLALQWGLAQQVCTGQPQSVVSRCDNMALLYKGKLDDYDVEDASTTFAPDDRMYEGMGRFRQ